MSSSSRPFCACKVLPYYAYQAKFIFKSFLCGAAPPCCLRERLCLPDTMAALQDGQWCWAVLTYPAFSWNTSLPLPLLHCGTNIWHLLPPWWSRHSSETGARTALLSLVCLNCKLFSSWVICHTVSVQHLKHGTHLESERTPYFFCVCITVI